VVLEWTSETGKRNVLSLAGAIRIIEQQEHTLVRYATGHQEVVPIKFDTVMKTVRGESYDPNESNDCSRLAYH
jgi:hypothetical protein